MSIKAIQKKTPKKTTATHYYTFHFFPPLLFSLFQRSFLYLIINIIFHFFSQKPFNTGKNYRAISAFFSSSMGLLKKIAGFLGLSKDDNHESKDEDDDNNSNSNSNSNSEAQTHTHNNSNRSSAHFQETGRPRKGFSVPVQVSLDRPHLGPLLSPCKPPDAAVQGLRWYAKALRIDEDGDVADEFLDEVLLESSTSTEDHQRSYPKFEVKYSTRPAKVKSLLLAPDGKIRQCVEHQGRLQWV